MKVVVASSLENSYGLRDGYVPIANAHVHTLSVGLAVGLDFMSVPDLSDSLLLLLEPQCTARSCRFGNGFSPFIT